jgi:hypothetical protein
VKNTGLRGAPQGRGAVARILDPDPAGGQPAARNAFSPCFRGAAYEDEPSYPGAAARERIHAPRPPNLRPASSAPSNLGAKRDEAIPRPSFAAREVARGPCQKPHPTAVATAFWSEPDATASGRRIAFQFGCRCLWPQAPLGSVAAPELQWTSRSSGHSNASRSHSHKAILDHALIRARAAPASQKARQFGIPHNARGELCSKRRRYPFRRSCRPLESLAKLTNLIPNAIVCLWN